jgi:hypothetical protein
MLASISSLHVAMTAVNCQVAENRFGGVSRCGAGGASGSGGAASEAASARHLFSRFVAVRQDCIAAMV